jgi:hypothetical protein
MGFGHCIRKMADEQLYAPRDPAYMFISSRPAEKVRDEVSIIFGYEFKPNSDASIEVSGVAYAMCTQAADAWVKNAAEECQRRRHRRCLFAPRPARSAQPSWPGV